MNLRFFYVLRFGALPARKRRVILLPLAVPSVDDITAIVSTGGSKPAETTFAEILFASDSMFAPDTSGLDGTQSFIPNTKLMPSLEETREEAPPSDTPVPDTVANTYSMVATMPDLALHQAPPAIELIEDLSAAASEINSDKPEKQPLVSPEIELDFPRHPKRPRSIGKNEEEPVERVDFVLDTRPPAAPIQIPIQAQNQAIEALPPEPQDLPPARPLPSNHVPGAITPQPAIKDTVALASTASPITNAPVILEARISPKNLEPVKNTPAVSEAPNPELTSDAPPASVPQVAESFSAGEKREEDQDLPKLTAQQESPMVPQRESGSAPAPVSVNVPQPSKHNPETRIDAPKPPAPVQEPQPPPGAERTPLKQLEVRIPADDGSVTVRLHERGGALHVSVRSADANVASGVAERLPDLTRALDREGFRAEAWTPQNSSLRDARVDDILSSPAGTQIVENGTTAARMEHTPTEDEPSSGQRDQNWQDEQQRRRKRPQEDFEEYLK